jgi:peroxiredoxin
MRMHRLTIGAATLAALLALLAISKAPQAFADAAAKTEEKEAKKHELALGDPAPAWKKLEGVDDKPHSLADLKKAKAVVVVFTCNECPVAKAYEDRLSALQKDYAEKGVAVIAINTNNSDAEKLPAMKERAKEKDFQFVYLDDSTQEISREYGATVTPHAFILDAKRRVVYRGAIDDEMDESKVTKHYVRDALDDVLAGKKPQVAESKQFGCGIHYE